MRTQKQFSVSLYLSGDATRHVMAVDKADAIKKVSSMLLEADGTTPKKTALVAFSWSFPSPHVRDLNGRDSDWKEGAEASSLEEASS